ncbi:phosphatidylglycerol lysyltransferase domain-containing protein [Bacillus salinus]|uniref:phosphatidylglycerol lysyltransferase domain-containing protein n=1 Tax=Bacillus sp. HMF5848 TaxID=2495421 RepID=UPI00163A41B6|nr:phosphatidylglycerol lysyltransferase domain-containing protein [Bacillus sp. HMF5848]
MIDTQIIQFEVIVLLITWTTLLYFQKSKTLNNDVDITYFTQFIKKNGGNHLSHLTYMQDKDVYWAQEKQVAFIYKIIANKAVVLGDPLGDQVLLKRALVEFNDYCQKAGIKPIYYQICPENMQYYHELGYTFRKIGEEGIVSLDTFSLTGKNGAKLRSTLNKFTRNSYTFRVLQPPYSKELLQELTSVSNNWLANKKEKGFSVVAYSDDYVSNFPIGVIEESNGRIVAFATIATDYKNNVTIDLMRKHQESPAGTMDVMFVHILNWAKGNGYNSCSLGMAPLANVGQSKDAFFSEKLLRIAYEKGNKYYNFKGLFYFKTKFATNWEPKYVAYTKSPFPVILLQLMMLINSDANRKPKLSIDMIKKLFLIKKEGGLS